MESDEEPAQDEDVESEADNQGRRYPLSVRRAPSRVPDEELVLLTDEGPKSLRMQRRKLTIVSGLVSCRTIWIPCRKSTHKN